MRSKLMSAVAALALAACASGANAQNLNRDDIREAVGQLADRMQASYVFPEVAQQYAEHLRARRDAGAFDAYVEPAALADALQREMNGVHRDAHLGVVVNETEPGEPAPRRGPPPADQAFGDARWLADGVAYLRIGGFPGDEAAVARMGALLDQYASARTLILDARRCPGGGLEAMNVLFSRLYAQPTRLLNMDTRTGANPALESEFSSAPDVLRREDAPAGITRFVHWALPTTPVNELADARVYVLTDVTASACEHMALALQSTGRATLVGGVTRGAGHFGGEQAFGDGRFLVWLPVGRTYVAATNWDWEGHGIEPDRAVAPAEALNSVLAELGVEQSAASAEVAQPRMPALRRVQAAPGPSYGFALAPPRGGEDALPILDILDGSIAAGAGIQRGDRILSLNGTPVSQIPPDDFRAYMRANPLVMVIDRAGAQLTFELSRLD